MMRRRWPWRNRSRTSSRWAAASTRPGGWRWAAATSSSSPARSARRPTSSPRTTCAPARARSWPPSRRTARQTDVHFAAKAFPCTAVLELFAQEGLACDVAGRGELEAALRAGFDPSRIHVHGNAKTEDELRRAVAGGRRPRRPRQRGRDRPARAHRARRRAPARADAHRPRREPRHASRDLHGRPEHEVRLLAGRRAGGDRARAGLGRLRAGGAALPHRLADPRPGAVPRGAGGDRAPGALRRREPRRRPRRGLHAGRPPALDRGLRRREGAPRARDPRRPGAADPRRARPRARGQRLRDALHRAVGQAQRRDLGRGRRRHGRQPAPDALRRALRGAPRRPLRRARDARQRRRPSLRVGRRDRPRRRPRRPARGRRDRHAGHRRLRPRDGQHLQRLAAAAGRVRPRRRRARGRAARDLRRPVRADVVDG